MIFTFSCPYNVLDYIPVSVQELSPLCVAIFDTDYVRVILCTRHRLSALSKYYSTLFILTIIMMHVYSKFVIPNFFFLFIYFNLKHTFMCA